MRTSASRQAEKARDAREAGQITVLRECKHHGETEFTIEGAGYYRCKRCRMEAVVKRRRKVKAILVAEAGGRCVICGYDRYLGALEFHHVDPASKRLAISWNGVTQSLEAVRAEARKCVLLCSNCHGEVEAGVTALPRYAQARSP
jgi:5-methylcytosine-specific restriction endonuclease McrA